MLYLYEEYCRLYDNIIVMLALVLLSALLVLSKLAYRWLRRPVRSLSHRLLALSAGAATDGTAKLAVLLVTAHPDDECMFFGPTCRQLLADGPFSPFTVHLLCLSRGCPPNSPSSTTRVKELRGSCRHLGIRTCLCPAALSRATTPDGKEDSFVDGFEQQWRAEDVAAAIGEAVGVVDADCVVSFDSRGVSGHPNHRALFHGLTQYANADGSRRCLALESLHPVLTPIKYLGPLAMVFDAVLEMLIGAVTRSPSRRLFAVPDPLNEYWIVRRAMAEHASQLTWYRRLYLLFSRYMYINSLREL